jgi:hypothetical protein
MNKMRRACPRESGGPPAKQIAARGRAALIAAVLKSPPAFPRAQSNRLATHARRCGSGATFRIGCAPAIRKSLPACFASSGRASPIL